MNFIILIIFSERAKEHIEQELHNSKTNNKEINILQEEIKDLKENLSSLRKKFRENERELLKERAKTKSISMHSEVSVIIVLFAS